jgi:phosphatidylserine decarboxylase
MAVFDKFPLAASGLGYVAGYLFLALAATALQVWWLAVPLWAAAALMVWFFRDPARQDQAGPGAVISPADGKVVAVQEAVCPDLPGGRARMVSIFMNLLDVHVNRVPISGQVKKVNYVIGGFMPADRPRAREANERQEVVIATDRGGTLMVAQVAGLVARRIECRLVPGDQVQRGQRFGMILFGSRLDVYMPLEATVTVTLGQRVTAGQSQIGEM